MSSTLEHKEKINLNYHISIISQTHSILVQLFAQKTKTWLDLILLKTVKDYFNFWTKNYTKIGLLASCQDYQTAEI